MLARQPLAKNVAPAANSIPARERLIVALDVPSVEDASSIVKELGAYVDFYKIGLQLQFVGGLELAKRLIGQGKKVFIDSKLWDIEQTITNAVRSAVTIHATFLTVHGERKVIEAAVKGRGSSDLKILAVTFLTNLDEHDLKDMHFSGSIDDFVLFRTNVAIQAGADGVISSGHETSAIRRLVGNKLTIVNPGIRPSSAPPDDQRRRVTPYEAIRAGADYLVVGRPILNASSKVRAANEIVQEIEKGLAEQATFAV
jgi:orotidine-5'-phosphate decarboxylase